MKTTTAHVTRLSAWKENPMAANLTALPDGYFQCAWCSGGVRNTADGGWPSRCPHCGLNPHPSLVDETVGGKVDPIKARTSGRNRRSAPRIVPLDPNPVGRPILGVDPGAKYTGLVIRDGDAVLFAATLVRDNDSPPVDWARHVVHEIKNILAVRAPMPLSVEGVSDPKGFKRGTQAPLNPAHIMRAAVVLGAVVSVWDDAVVIPPGGNGSQHVTHYPPALVGRRPKDLPGDAHGAKTRAHEQSAYDVAGRGAAVIWPKQPIPLADLIRDRRVS